MRRKSGPGVKERFQARREQRRSLRTERAKARAKAEPPRRVYVGSHEDKLSRLSAIHVDPDDDGKTREDRHADRSVFADSVLEPVDMPRWLRGRRRARRDKLTGMD
jgi:hypothetical protein